MPANTGKDGDETVRGGGTLGAGAAAGFSGGAIIAGRVGASGVMRGGGAGGAPAGFRAAALASFSRTMSCADFTKTPVGILNLGASAAGAATTGAAGWASAGFAPDFALFYDASKGLAKGQLPPRAVGAYNLMHRFWGPLAVLVPAAFGLIGLGFLIGALAWGFHIALDRAIGYGLRTRDGFQRP